MPLSAVDCIQPAIQHTKQQLFTRFRLGQWTRLALVGVLAAELHVGGCNFGNIGQVIQEHRNRGKELVGIPQFPQVDPSRIAQFAGLIGVVLLLGAVIFFVFLYINSIFRFILFDSVVKRECSIGEGWQHWSRAGGRFFLWQLVFQIALGIFFAVLIGIPVALAMGAGWMRSPDQHKAGMIGGLLLLVGVILIFALVAAIVQILAKDFLVPIMALEGLDFADGWSRLLALMRPEPGRYGAYVVLKIVLAIAAAIVFSIAAIIPVLFVVLPCTMIVLAAKTAGLTWTVATVSLAVIGGAIAVLVLIYLVALVSVPGTVFFPAYALYFFAGRYPNLGALLYPAPAPTAPAAPEIPPPPLEPPSPEPIG